MIFYLKIDYFQFKFSMKDAIIKQGNEGFQEILNDRSLQNLKLSVHFI